MNLLTVTGKLSGLIRLRDFPVSIYDPDSPGETLALMEVFGLNNVKLKRFPYTSRTSYFIVE